MLANVLKSIFLILVLKCCNSIQQSDSCRSIVTVSNAWTSSTRYMTFNTNRSLECKQQCLYDTIKCNMAAWNMSSHDCHMFSDAGNTITTEQNVELYYIFTSSCICSSTTPRANDWNPIQNNPTLNKLGLIPMNETDLVNCTRTNFNFSFVFDFSTPGKCYQITGYGTNNRTFSQQTYIFLRNVIFFGECEIEIKQIPIPTNYITYTPVISTSPVPTPKVTNSEFEQLMMVWDYKPLVLRPAYIVIVGLGGACVLMTILAVVVLCQGKLGGGGGGGGTSRKHVMNYSDENGGEPMEMHNQMYDTDVKDENVDLTLPHQGEYLSE